MYDKETLVTNLIKFRKEKGLSRWELAKKSGQTYQYIKKLEEGKTESPSLKNIYYICKCLDCTIEELIKTKTIDDIDLTEVHLNNYREKESNKTKGFQGSSALKY